ncbi:carbohydrate ABC transporter permease [Paenibacillus sp.]|uniref:carbohydrate ABC transporter permease n=1 Tax=Paenibacillus sp. TaxID=58172 RepID=UPI002D50E709|nr:carbohydrate ABC transporter permease [Paenibacillus sp.]HZG57542.1 carbohydrate ABC transporter permease [Paenibacillus sp.]
MMRLQTAGVRRSRPDVAQAAIFVVLLALTFCTLLPLVHIVAISFSDKTAVAAGKVFLWPVQFSGAAYDAVTGDKDFYAAFLVSVKRVALGVAISLTLTVLAAFALSRRPEHFRARAVYVWILVFSMMFSGGMIPWYLTIRDLHLINTIWALVLPSAVQIFNIIILMNFLRNLPRELDEAAEVDGAGPWQTLALVSLPMSLPSLATVTLFGVVFHWNSFFDGLILMNSQENYPLQTYLNQIVVQMGMMDPNMTKEDIEQLAKLSDKTVSSAKILVSMVPILLVYPLLQKYFITGLTLGSVKE